MSTPREQDFLKTMIDTLKYDGDDYLDASELITILRYSKIKFIETNLYAKLNNQYYENIELRVPINMLKKARILKKNLEKLICLIYQEDRYQALGTIFIKPKIIDSNLEVIKEHEVFFEEIKNEILQSIRGAKYTIWIVVAWFTDNDIFLELKQKKDAGLNIRVIMSDESTNQQMIEKLKKENFDIKIIPRFGYNSWNRMHEKFCIIDLEYVLHGSYNWTPTASYNDETLATALDKEYVSKFCNNFLELYNR